MEIEPPPSIKLLLLFPVKDEPFAVAALLNSIVIS
jgi:hypothetical protein